MDRRTRLVWLLLIAIAAPATAQSPLQCTPSAEGTPTGILGRAAAAMGMPLGDRQPLRVRAWRETVNDFQSDRTYPPFFSSFESIESFADPRTGALATRRRAAAFPRTEAGPSPVTSLSGSWAAWFLRDTLTIPAGSGAEQRALDPWSVVYDFLRTPDVRVEGRCAYRDYPRLALTRTGVFGPERLLVDPRTFAPVALVREEPHALFGQVAAEYVWSNWEGVEGGGIYPLTAFRQIDGANNITQTVTAIARVARDSTPRMAIPDTAFRGPAVPAAFAQPPQPDTVRVSANTWLLVNPFYTITVTLQRDTVFVLDATLSEVRARQDAAWIAQLFPGRHPVVLVVTDLAYPHIGGVRYWVASGATVISHRASEAFLRQIVQRRWTRQPDLLEQQRSRARFRFIGVDDSLVLAGGAVVLHPIDGIASEAALMAWLPGDRFLWASDYIQNTRAPSEYAHEVLNAVRRTGIEPERFAAEHVRLTPWSVIDSLHPEPRAGTDAADASTLRVGRITRYASVTRGGAVEDRGPQVQEMSRGTWRGRPALISVRVFTTPQGQAVDSSIADAATLAPIRHTGHHPDHVMILDFDGSRVTGRYAPAGEAGRPIDQRLAARPYDSSLFDLVFAALPLADGYRARIPIYIYEQGGAPLWWEGRVTGSETLTLRDGTTADVWAMDVFEGDRRRCRLWITRGAEREVVRSTYYIGGGAEYVITR